MMRTLQVSAPGSMMVTGEHAVVYGQPAIVCAIEQRIHIRVTALDERIAEVHSTIAAPVIMSLDDIVIEGPMKFVLAVIAHYADQLQCGLRLNITSEIDQTMGLGSSAAVTAASLAAIDRLAHGNELQGNEQPDNQLPDISQLHNTGLKITRDIQGRGSGADLAASLHGGMIAYQLPAHSTDCTDSTDASGNASMHLLPTPQQLSLCYVGYKTPTAEVLARIAIARKGNEQFYDDLYDQMGDCARATIVAAEREDWISFGHHLQQYQHHMQTLGVSDSALDHLIAEGRRNPDTMAVKISGSGLGDCVLALGGIPEGFTRLTVASKGLLIDA